MRLIVNTRPPPPTELRAARSVLVADRLRLGTDAQSYRVLAVHVAGLRPDACCRLTVRGEDDGARLLLVRTGQDLLQVLIAAAGTPEAAA